MTLDFLILFLAETATGLPPRFHRTCDLLAQPNLSELFCVVPEGDPTKIADLVSSGDELVKGVSLVLILD